MIKRYSREELIEILNNLGIKELATATKRWECTTVAEEDTSLFKMNLKTRLTNGKVYRERIKDFRAKAEEDGMIAENKKIYNKAVDLLEKLCSDDELSDMAYQKELYAKEKNIYNSRSYLEFPLDKVLNALYDDFSAVYLYYDNISTLKNNKVALVESYNGDREACKRFARLHLESKEEQAEFLKLTKKEDQIAWARKKFGKDAVEVFEELATEQEKIDHVQENIEFTHCMLGGANSPSWGIGVYGEMEKKFTKFDDNQQALLHEYCDFNKITLADTLKIRNNDLLQVMQSKIDIDRENLEIVDEKEVRGDVYQIKKLPEVVKNGRERFQYLIRYVCPSTGRVYHNQINEQSLSESKFYVSGDPTSFIHAWWHINNCGADPTKDQKVIRC